GEHQGEHQGGDPLALLREALRIRFSLELQPGLQEEIATRMRSHVGVAAGLVRLISGLLAAGVPPDLAGEERLINEIAALGQMIPRDIKAAAGGRQIEALDAFERERYRKAALDYAVLDTVAQRWDIDGLEALARSLNGELDIAPKAIADDLRDRE